MRRYPAYDPPEYVAWAPEPHLLVEYRERLDADPDRAREIRGLGAEGLLEMYEGLLRFRLHDIALARWVKGGVISKAWLGTGEEAVTIGAVHALDRRTGEGDVVGPMIRNAGACHEMGLPVADMLRAYLATADGPTGGRDLHVGDLSRGICAPISMVASLATVMNGIALSFKLRDEPRVALTWVGDGATKHGEAHEAFAFAAAQGLPIVFIIQNNQVALGTTLDQHHVPEDFRALGDAYGVPALAADGNHVLDVYAAVRLAAGRCRRGGGPAFIEARTFRMGGHATHDVAEARRTFPAEWFERWGRRDPIGLFEEFLATGPVDLGGAGDGDRETRNRAVLEAAERRVEAEVETAARVALESREQRMPEPRSVSDGVYAEAER